MNMATQILALGGLGLLAYAFVIGFAFHEARKTQEHAPRYLLMTHVGLLMQGTMMLALTAAVPLVRLPDGVKIAGAALLVLGAVCAGIRDTINWRRGVTDEYKQKPPVTPQLALLGALSQLAGLAILVVGVVLGF
jgi:hypothetical protein